MVKYFKNISEYIDFLLRNWKTISEVSRYGYIRANEEYISVSIKNAKKCLTTEELKRMSERLNKKYFLCKNFSANRGSTISYISMNANITYMSIKVVGSTPHIINKNGTELPEELYLPANSKLHHIFLDFLIKSLKNNKSNINNLEKDIKENKAYLRKIKKTVKELSTNQQEIIKQKVKRRKK